MPLAVCAVAVLAFVGGMLVAAQGPIYARLSEGLDRNTLVAVFLAYGTAALLTGTMALATGGFRGVSATSIVDLPPWVWLGGLFGALHVVIAIQSVPVLGLTLFLVIVTIGSLFGGALYDHLGILGLVERPITLLKLAGLALVTFGVAVVALG